MGFIIAIITLLEFKGPALISFFVPVAILGIPILDTLFAIIRRLLKGQPPFQADKQHLHHQLLGMNFSQTTTVLIIYGINILFATAAIFFTIKDPIIGEILFIIIFIIVIWFVFHTTIISDKYPKRTKKIADKLHMLKRRK
jgi:UDP-GlcNAc:undecaprenyl-phosphate GlcNAc-1-phosphate transferase